MSIGFESMSHPYDFSVQKSPLYTQGTPLAWVKISVLERRIGEFEQLLHEGRLRGIDLIKDTVPLSLEVYVALNTVSYLLAKKLASSPEITASQCRFSGLSGLLIFITDLIASINYGTFPRSLFKSS